MTLASRQFQHLLHTGIYDSENLLISVHIDGTRTALALFHVPAVSDDPPNPPIPVLLHCTEIGGIAGDISDHIKECIHYLSSFGSATILIDAPEPLERDLRLALRSGKTNRFRWRFQNRHDSYPLCNYTTKDILATVSQDIAAGLFSMTKQFRITEEGTKTSMRLRNMDPDDMDGLSTCLLSAMGWIGMRRRPIGTATPGWRLY